MKEFLINPHMFTQEHIEYILEYYFGYWVDALYGCGNEFFSEQLGRKITYEEETEVFLALFKRMVEAVIKEGSKTKK